MSGITHFNKISGVNGVYVGKKGSEYKISDAGGFEIEAGTTVPGYRLVEISTDKASAATINSEYVVGANYSESEAPSNKEMRVVTGKTKLVAATPIKGGRKLKAGPSGTATTLVTSDVTGDLILEEEDGLGLTDQPTDDSIQILSDESDDKEVPVLIIGTTHGGVVVVTEEVKTDASNGTTPVTSTKTDWGEILAVKLLGTAEGTITVRKTVGPANITTVNTANQTRGVKVIPAADTGAFGIAPKAVGSSTTTKKVGMLYQPAAGGANVYQSVALTNDTPVAFAAAALNVREVYIGDLESGRNVSISVGDAEVLSRGIGRALEDALTGATFDAIVFP